MCIGVLNSSIKIYRLLDFVKKKENSILFIRQSTKTKLRKRLFKTGINKSASGEQKSGTTILIRQSII